MNKIIRSAYGPETEYQQLTQEALKGWHAWNAEHSASKNLPPGLNPEDRLFINNGELSLTDSPTLTAFEQATVDNMEAAGHKNTQLITTSPAHRSLAAAAGFSFAMDPFRRTSRGLPGSGVLDTTGGMAVADKACIFAMHKASQQGVRFVLDPAAGALSSLLRGADGDDKKGKVTGIKTLDGKAHPAGLTILACGGWTPSLLPSLDGLCETTAGSVFFLRIPPTSPLFQRFAPENFPTWTYKMRDGAYGGLYGFPRDENGWLKIGYRGTKYTNPVAQEDGKERSVPVTRWSSASRDPGERLTAVPRRALGVVEAFLAENLPELAAEGIGISRTRVCWYTDSFDNHFVIDHVPGTDGSLMVATGGSGHAFKYLPNIGNWVVNAVEGRGQEESPSRLWKWRKIRVDEEPYNVLMEGSRGPRALRNVPLASEVEVGADVTPKL